MRAGNGQVLVADIGGTYARCAIAELGEGGVALGPVQVQESAPHGSLDRLLSDYLRSMAHPPRRACLALAGPVRNGKAHLTNLGWTVDGARLAQALGFEQVILLNDFAALAYAVPGLTPEETMVVKPGTAQKQAPISVMGAGTGFGVAQLVPDPGGHALVATEGGHASFAPGDALEVKLWQKLRETSDRVSIEMLLSGDGLATIHQTLQSFDGVAERLMPEEICLRALEDAGSPSGRSLDLFCNILGTVAGDIALIHGAAGGVYLAGGVLTKNAGALKQSRFVERFKAKGVASSYVENIPVYLIRAEHAALRGAALWFASHRRAG